MLRLVLWIGASACLLLPVMDDPPLRTGAFVQDVTADAAVVALTFDAPAPLHLEVREAGGAVVARSGAPAARRHFLRATGLRPGRAYEFVLRRGEAGAEVDAGSFRTPSADDRTPFRFVALGDSGAQPWWVWLQRSPLLHWPARWGWLPPKDRVAAMGRQLAAAAPEFVLHLGDVIYPWGQQAHYGPGFFRPFAEVLRRAPCYVVLGNHDVMDDAGRQALADFALPANAVTGDERSYSFAWGALRVIVFDANAPIGEGSPPLRFLRQELAAATEPWLVVASHYPIQSCSRQGDRADLVRHVLPLLRERGVDLYLSGHDHTYQRFGQPGGLVQVVSGGGGKSLYDLQAHPQVVTARSRYHHCVVEVAGAVLRLRAIGDRDDLLDELELRKDPAQAEALRGTLPARAARIEALLR